MEPDEFWERFRLRVDREKLEREKLRLQQAADSGPEGLWEYFQQEMESCRKKVQEKMNERLLILGAQLDTTKAAETQLQEQLRKEKERSKQLEQAHERANAAETRLREQLKKEKKELLEHLEQAREQAKATETQLQEQVRKEHELLDQAREQVKATEDKLQEQLRKEQEAKEQDRKKREMEGRLRVAIEVEKARVHQELCGGFAQQFALEKALLMEEVRQEIQEVREYMTKEAKRKPGEQGERNILILGELNLEEEDRPTVEEERGGNVARD